MKRTLRMLCMGLAAAATSMAFAQEPQDFTQKLWNHDFEKGPHGWDITAESADANYSCWMPQIKGDVKAAGYYGHNNLALEIWQGSGTLKDNSLSQTVTDLPNGTYVFGAYMMATDQSRTENRDMIDGVYMFANVDEVPVATNIVEGGAPDAIWAHAGKFNVATVVEDGILKVGVKCVSTNINFTTIDNATLWYFGDMSTAAALDKMAQIDMQRSLAIADTCAVLKAAADSLAYLAEKMEAAKALTSAADAWTVDEELWWGMRLVRKSAKDYASLAQAIAAAKEVAAKEWSEYVQEDVEVLNALIAEAEAAYEAGSLSRAEIEAYTTSLPEAAATVELDDLWVLHEIYTEKLDSIDDFEGEDIGEYSSDMLEEFENLLIMVDEELNMVGEISALDAKANCEKWFADMQEIIDNPINYYEFPIFLHRSSETLPNQGSGASNQSYPVLEGSYLVDQPAGVDKNGNSYGARNNCAEYKSPLFRFREPLKSVRFIVHECGKPDQRDIKGLYASFCISSFAMYDEAGNEIELTEENLVSNANEPKPRESGGIAALLDGNPTTWFHSMWSATTPQAHYLEVTLPEGEYSAFSFKMTALSSNHTRPFPAEMEITYVSPKVTELQQAIVAAREYNPLFGTSPGFCNVDPITYERVLAECDAVVEKAGATDAEIEDAIAKANAVLAEAKEAGIMLPDPEKKYRIISAESRFFTNQNIMKAFTVHTDTIYGDWLWWETASPDSAQQEFMFEPLENEEGKLYYAIKNVKLDRYLSELRDSVGNIVENRFVFSENRDSFLLKSLGQGQFGIFAEGNSREQFNMEFHNNGAWSDVVANYGAIKGVTSYIHTWGANANTSSSWFFREMATLPHAAKSISALDFRSEAISLYEGISNVTLTADKECAFADLRIYNVFGDEVAVDEVTVDGKVATVKLASNLETFAFGFTNAEGVTEVTIDGSYEFRGEDPKLTELRTAYNNAVNKLVVQGTAVGQVVDTKEFDDALMNAQALLENGGDTDAFVAAKVAIDSAVAHLVYNLPVTGHNYFIQSALPWMKRWNSEMDVFVKEDDMAYWSYVNVKNLNHQWQFVDCGQLKNGMPAYYLYNVGTGFYLTTPRLEDNANGGRLYVVEDTTEAAPFNIHFLADGKVAIADSREGNANGSWALHLNNHQGGTGYVAHGYMISWGKGDAASAMRVVEAEKVISDFMTGIEDVEMVEEFVAPAAKGIYDLFGRRIDTPAATGIYIVDGKKRVIKK